MYRCPTTDSPTVACGTQLHPAAPCTCRTLQQVRQRGLLLCSHCLTPHPPDLETMSLRLWSGLASAARAACAPPLAPRANLRSLSTTAQLARLVAPPPQAAATSPLSKLRLAWPKAAPASKGSPSTSWSPTSLTSSFVRRAFSSSPARAVRDTYFPRGRNGGRGSSGGSGGGGGQQRPPSWWQNFRHRLDSISPNNITYALIGINGVIFFAWQYGYSTYVSGFNPDQSLTPPATVPGPLDSHIHDEELCPQRDEHPPGPYLDPHHLVLQPPDGAAHPLQHAQSVLHHALGR